MAVALRVAVLFLLPVASLARETISFNFGWRFSSGDPTKELPCTEQDFPIKLTTNCNSTFSAPLKSADDCRKACCPGSGYHPNCSVWTWCDRDDPAHWKENVTTGCYLGDSSAACPGTPSEIKWHGERRYENWGPPPSYSYSSPAYNDSAWEMITTPHDFVIMRDFDPTADSRHGYLPRKDPGWYRKRFNIPPEWCNPDTRVWLRFNGVFHTSMAWLDGQPLELSAGSKSGYTAFSVPLPLSTASCAAPHVLAMRVDASFGSGHWYEGGGIYRDCFIVAANGVHAVENGLFAPASFSRVKISSSASSVAINPSVEITNDGTMGVKVLAKFVVQDSNGTQVAQGQSAVAFVAKTSGTSTVILHPVPAALHIYSPQLWSPHSPELYLVECTIIRLDSNSSNSTLDSVSVTTGLRDPKFTADNGFVLNQERHILRGFSLHNDMAGVGAAVPARLTLFRAQMLRAVGGNIW
jgi:beta-galactosidase/beta-glucuronidase